MFTLIGLGVGARRTATAPSRPSRPGSSATASGCTARRDLLRHGRRHHRARAARPGARAARAPSRPAPRSGMLLGLAPKTAHRAAAAAKKDVPLDDVQPGDILRVRPGEKVPVDGVVVDGARGGRRVDGDRRVDARWTRRPGDRVIGATMVGQRHASPCARSASARDTAVAQIVRMVGEAQRTARADSAARRSRRRVLRPGRRRWRAIATVRRLGAVGPEPRLAHGAGERRRRADHRAARARSGSRRRWRSWSATGRGAHGGVLIRNAEALERSRASTRSSSTRPAR